jgi:hypothetical protein
MGTTQQNDDDLIILTDDVQADSNDEMVINLDSEDKSTDDDVILTFDEADETSVTNEAKVEETKDTEEITLVDEDPFVITEESTPEESPIVELDSENKSEDMDLDFGSLDLD